MTERTELAQYGGGHDEHLPARTQQTEAMQMAVAQYQKMVEAQTLLAVKRERDEDRSYTKIMKACRRKGLAKDSEYDYQRGGQRIRGVSVHLARVIAAYWGNVEYGWVELARDTKRGESHVSAYAWDIENNVKENRIFVVPHYRETKSGRHAITSERDLYEHIANHAARRVRECIINLIPRDIVDDARDECRRTLISDGEPIEKKIKRMLLAFDRFGVTKEHIEQKFGKHLHALTPHDLAKLRGIYNAMRDGIASFEDNFEKLEPKKEEQEQEPSSKAEQLAKRMRQPATPKEPEPEKPKKRRASRKKTTPKPEQPETVEPAPQEQGAEPEPEPEEPTAEPEQTQGDKQQEPEPEPEPVVEPVPEDEGDRVVLDEAEQDGDMLF